jgi:hypothetical protein
MSTLRLPLLLAAIPLLAALHPAHAAKPDPRVAAAVDAFRAQHGSDWTARYDARGRLLALDGGTTAPLAGSPGDAALAFVLANPDLFGIEDPGTLAVGAVADGPAGSHVDLVQTYAGLAVFDGGIGVQLDPAGRVYQLQNAYVPGIAVSPGAVRSSAEAVDIALHALFARLGSVTSDAEVLAYDLGVAEAPAGAHLAHRVQLASVGRDATRDYLVDDVAGAVVRDRSLVQRLVDGQGRAFDPNPVVTLNDQARALRDLNDADHPSFANAYLVVTLPDLDEPPAGVPFRLTGRYVRSVNLGPPNIAPITVANRNAFVFDRQQDAFEEVMVYYHVDRGRRRLAGLGFAALVPTALRADAHGAGNQDNAFYSLVGLPGQGTLRFGDGGGSVDNAEDADTILHEVGHSIQDAQNRPAYGVITDDCDTEAEAQGEGFGDYWAGSMGRAASQAAGFDPECLFEWDDQPECSRRLDAPRRWVLDAEFECHEDGQIWSGALWKILLQLGRDAADRLVLTHHPLVGRRPPTFNEAACALLFADRRLNAGANVPFLDPMLRERGLLVRCSTDPCVFDTNGDGIPELELEDVDRNGYCEFPSGKTHLKGTLVFDATNPVEFVGNTIVEADAIVVRPDGRLSGDPRFLRSLTMVAYKTGILSLGTVELVATDDVLVRALGSGSVELRGRTALWASDRVLVESAREAVVLAPPALDDLHPVLRGGNRVDVLARGTNGRVTIERSTFASRRVTVSTRANVSVVGAKFLEILDGSVLTTDPLRTKLAGSPSEVFLTATGPIRVIDSELDSGTDVRIATSRLGDDVCFGGGSRVEAIRPNGQPKLIDLTAVRGTVREDGTTQFLGTLRGTVVPGPCP